MTSAEPDEDGDTDLPDELVPLTEVMEDAVPLAELPEEAELSEEIPEESVPMAQVPETGDAALLWALVSVLSGAALAWMTICGRNTREETI